MKIKLLRRYAPKDFTFDVLKEEDGQRIAKTIRMEDL